MKFLSSAVVALTLMAGAALADPIEGTWQTQADDGAYAHVKIAPCGPAFCGVITRSFNASGEFKSENTGKQIVTNMTPKGDGTYTGKVLRPADGKVYNGKASVSGNSMKLSGCVAGGLICKSQSWKKIN